MHGNRTPCLVQQLYLRKARALIKLFLRDEALRNVLLVVMFLGREDIDRGKICRLVAITNTARARAR